MKQTDRLLCYLADIGPITPMQAWNELGIYRLGARIWDLKKAGHNIVATTVTVKNRFDEPCHVAQYALVSQAALPAHRTLSTYAKLMCFDCVDSGIVRYLTRDQYDKQMRDPDKGWRCPQCRCYPCVFDDAYFMLPLKEE